VKKLLSDKEFEKYKALYHKFMKVSGIHQLELKQWMHDQVIEGPLKPGAQVSKQPSPDGVLFVD